MRRHQAARVDRSGGARNASTVATIDIRNIPNPKDAIAAARISRNTIAQGKSTSHPKWLSHQK